ncbi:MAG: heparinase II/III family protein, partial [bacterium]
MTRQGRQGMVPSEDLPTRIRRRLRVLHARTRYRLGLPEPDAGEVGIAPSFRHPIDAAQRSLLTAQYRDLFPDAVLTELAEARRLAAHRFALLGHTVDYGERITWIRDPVSGREWSRGFSPDIPYRGAGRLGDIKLPWELNKHQYFFTLGKAAWLTDDPALAGEIVRQIAYWIEDNPCHRGINWIDALQVGTRAISWIMAYPFYVDCCDTSFRRRLASSLAQHVMFVEGHLSTGRFANTHLIGEAAGLVAGGLFLDCRDSRLWLEKGLAILEDEMERQVTPDGVHAERSVAYHRFFLDHYHLVSALLAANRHPLPEAICRGMERMTDFLRDVLHPDGTPPAFGDGDDARGLWFRTDCPAEYRSLLALGAVLFA